MNIVIACDSFKGCASSLEIAGAVASGIRSVSPLEHITMLPVADGGEGTVDVLVSGLGGSFRDVSVTGPAGARVIARYGLIGNDTAVMEMAAASGLTLVSEKERNPLITTTYGTGEMIADALGAGCRRIIIGIGGSATNDGGAGMAQALGVIFTDIDGNDIGLGGKALGSLMSIDTRLIDRRIGHCECIVLCDVDNPLCGERGASAVYGPQKGAGPADVRLLDKNLKHYAEIIRESMDIDVCDVPGAGAAGGLGAGMMAFCNAHLKPGIQTILDIVGIDRYLESADLVITGEGRIDGQSAFGKVPVGIAERARKKGVPVIAITGSIGEGSDAVYAHGVDAVYAIAPGPVSLEYSMNHVLELTASASERLMRIILSVSRFKKK